MSEKNNIERSINEKGLQFRDLDKVEFFENESKELIIEGRAIVYNTPIVLYSINGNEYKEVIDKRAVDEADISDVIFNYNHGGRVYARTRNNTLSLINKDDGLYIKAILRKNDEGHKQLYEDIKYKNIDKMSFAFEIEESAFNKDTYTRRITKIKKLYDVSAVDIPAYDTTSISARSFLEMENKTKSEEESKRQQALELEKAKYFY